MLRVVRDVRSNDSPAAHLDHSVCQHRSILAVVSDVHHRHVRRALDAQELGAQRGTQIRVEAGERLVHQQDRRTSDNRARECHTLLLATRKLVRISRGEFLDPHGREGLLHS